MIEFSSCFKNNQEKLNLLANSLVKNETMNGNNKILLIFNFSL